MQEGNGYYRLKPEWVEIANDKDVFRMASALYFDLKQHRNSGTVINPAQVEEMVAVVQKVLYTEYNWSEEEVGNLGKEFTELTKHCLTEMEESQMAPVIKAMLPQIMKGINLTPPNGGQGFGTASVHMEFVRHKSEKNSKWKFVKSVVVSVFKIAVYWLALLGLLILLGL